MAATTTFLYGSVGINDDSPDQSLCVGGNCRVTGSVFQPSDRRVKEEVAGLSTAAELAAVNAVPVYGYTLGAAWARAAGRERDPDEVGVLAQELRAALPDAVAEVGDRKLPGGAAVDGRGARRAVPPRHVLPD